MQGKDRLSLKVATDPRVLRYSQIHVRIMVFLQAHYLRVTIERLIPFP